MLRKKNQGSTNVCDKSLCGSKIMGVTFSGGQIFKGKQNFGLKFWGVNTFKNTEQAYLSDPTISLGLLQNTNCLISTLPNTMQ